MIAARTRLPFLALVALVMALTLTWSTTDSAEAARRPDNVATAKNKIEGQSLTNRHTHMRTWIVGFYPYHRLVRIKHRWRPHVFYGLRVSAQRCDTDHCWGRVVKGKLWSPHQPGRPMRSGPDKAAARPTGVKSDLCLQGTTTCAAPWNWFARYIDKRQVQLVTRYVDPCADAAVRGAVGALSVGLSARILFESGVMTAAKAASFFAGPAGVAVGALGGCINRVAGWGLDTVSALADRLSSLFSKRSQRG